MEDIPMGANQFPVEHIVVLMLENRSYDHMLGYLPHGQPLTGNEYNLVDPSDPASEKVYVSSRSGYITAVNPSHDFCMVDKQLYSEPDHHISPAPMNGFVESYTETAKGDVETGKTIMECFDPAKIPALTTLVREFCLCDHWHASVPGPTWPNRFFAHAATSDAVVADEATHLYDMKTIYDSLTDNGFTWTIYYGDIPQSIILQHGGDKLGHFEGFYRFHTDLDNGELATYTFIEPRYLDFFEWKANDQHAPHDVKLGEYLIAEVYDALRASRFWETTLLVVLYDEHGGFFDRIPPPEGVPNPDGKQAVDPSFDFTRLGVRVPAVLVSPWVEKGSIDSTIYEHASLPATVRTVFGLPTALTARDAAANTFEKNLSRRSPRTATPKTLPVPGEPEEIDHHRGLVRLDALEAWLGNVVNLKEQSSQPLSTLQEALVGLADRLNEKGQREVPVRAGQGLSEHEAGIHVHEALSHLLKR
jgi:phospholipase C